MNRMKSPRKEVCEFEFQNIEINNALFHEEVARSSEPNKDWQRRERGRGEEELSLPTIPYENLGTEH